MSTLAQFGLWQKVQEPAKPGSETGFVDPKPGSDQDGTRGNTGSNQDNQENRVSSPSQPCEGKTHTHAYAGECASRMGENGKPGKPGKPDSGPVKSRAWTNQALDADRETRFHPASRTLGAADRQGEAEDVQSARHAEPDWWRPKPLPVGSLVQRLCAAGATVRTWSNGRGGQASIEAPAGIPADLLREVEARGWRIIPGGKPNSEAEHDSWLAGVPIAELER